MCVFVHTYFSSNYIIQSKFSIANSVDTYYIMKIVRKMYEKSGKILSLLLIINVHDHSICKNLYVSSEKCDAKNILLVMSF